MSVKALQVHKLGTACAVEAQMKAFVSWEVLVVQPLVAGLK